MATNRHYPLGRQLSVTPTSPSSGGKSGDPCVLGQRPGVLLEDQKADNMASVDFDGVYTLSVKGIDGSGNSAVAAGDLLYFTAGDTPPISKKATGVRFGYALGAVTSAATAAIDVAVGY